MSQVIKLKCAKCGHRTFQKLDVTGGDPIEPGSSMNPPHIYLQPSGATTEGPLIEADELNGWFEERHKAFVEESTSRWTYRCHPKCGADVPVRLDNLSTAISRAVARGRDVVWLPTDL